MRKKIPKIRKSAPQTEIETRCYSNGKVESKISYVNGKKHGMAVTWREDGSKQCEQMWRDGKPHGSERWWNSDGGKWREQMHVDDKWHGLERMWHDNGSNWHVNMCRVGDKHGVCASWHKNGQKSMDSYYILDEVYARIEWDEKGHLSEVKFPFSSRSRTQLINSKANQKPTKN